jgi:hypothetical protein
MVAVPWSSVPGATSFVVLDLQVGKDLRLILQLATEVGHLGQQRADLRPGVSCDSGARWIELLSRLHHRDVLHALIRYACSSC